MTAQSLADATVLTMTPLEFIGYQVITVAFVGLGAFGLIQLYLKLETIWQNHRIRRCVERMKLNRKEKPTNEN